MTLPMISARGVSKLYELGALKHGTKSLREAMVNGARAVLRPSTRPKGESFLALDDVSFDVQLGDVMGVIGRNGAGKSTLLKVLSRITEPTKGRIEMRGRVASLLEVGTGFHPELTGRENVYLNGTILGMRKRDIDRKFDEIVDFAEVGRFVDTPVKRYSSGMYVRLAFGVAAHLDPEILIVDEVLAVGDAEFQKKCLGKMSDVASEGRTVLFVSHNMAAIRSICTTGLHLTRGRVTASGPIAEVIDQYAKQGVQSGGTRLSFPPSDAKPQYTSLSIDDPVLSFGDIVDLRGTIESPVEKSVAVEFEVHDERGVPVAYCATAPMGAQLLQLEPGRPQSFHLRLGPVPLARGRYTVWFGLTTPWVETYHMPGEPLTFEIVHSDPEGTGYDYHQSEGRGVVHIPISLTEL